MSRHKTALGKTIDMTALIAKNEKVRAVGNMGINARGDKIDSNGRVIVSNNQRVNNTYSKTVGNKSAQVKVRQNSQRQLPQQSLELPGEKLETSYEEVKPEIKEELTEYEKEMQEMFDEEDVEIESIKKPDNKKWSNNG